MNAELQALFARYLMAMADDELVIGYRDTEWTGVGPALEEDLAFSSIGLDEIGHARECYSLLHELTGTQIDYRARAPHEYLHAQYVELASAPRYDPAGAHEGGGDWVYAIVRQYLYDLFDAERLRSLAGCGWSPLAQAVAKIAREEKYHLQHGQTWIERLAVTSPEARQRLQATLARAWPDALGLFEPVAGEAALVRSGLLPMGAAQLRDRWLERLADAMRPYELPLPAVCDAGAWQLRVSPRTGGRRGQHTPDWEALWEQVTSVYRLDPTAVW